MNRTIALLVLLAPLAAAAESAVSLVDLKAAGGPLVAQCKREAVAKKSGLNPAAELTATWCKPHAAIKHYLGDPAMVDAFTGVRLIRVELDDWKQSALDAAGLHSPCGRTPTAEVAIAEPCASGTLE
jgi:hypothetical protein